MGKKAHKSPAVEVLLGKLKEDAAEYKAYLDKLNELKAAAPKVSDPQFNIKSSPWPALVDDTALDLWSKSMMLKEGAIVKFTKYEDLPEPKVDMKPGGILVGQPFFATPDETTKYIEPLSPHLKKIVHEPFGPGASAFLEKIKQKSLKHAKSITDIPNPKKPKTAFERLCEDVERAQSKPKEESTEMARIWDPDSINESVNLPAGEYVGQIHEISETQTKEAGKLMYVAQLEVIEPAEYAGLHQRDNFVIGSDQDTEATDPNTWAASLGARRMKTLFKQARVPFDKDLDKMRLKAAGHIVGFVLVHKPDKSDPSRVNINVTSYKQHGSGAPSAAPVAAQAAAPKLAAVPGSGSVATAAQATKAAKPKSSTITCPTCDELVLKTEFAAHAEAHEEEATA